MLIRDGQIPFSINILHLLINFYWIKVSAGLSTSNNYRTYILKNQVISTNLVFQPSNEKYTIQKITLLCSLIHEKALFDSFTFNSLASYQFALYDEGEKNIRARHVRDHLWS